MSLNGKTKKYGIVSSFIGGALALIIFITAISTFNPLQIPIGPMDWETDTLKEGSAATFSIKNLVETSFSTYIPETLDYTPKVSQISIAPGLSNVNFQGLKITEQTKDLLSQYGFTLVAEGVEDIYEIYENDEDPKFITTDLCLHAYHVLYDISLRVLEGDYFSDDFQLLLDTLRTDQMTKRTQITEPLVLEASSRNIAYLSVMLYLLDNTTIIPNYVEEVVNTELTAIQDQNSNISAIFNYKEDYTQYKIRGHYTRNEVLSKYFKAMMYAGRMSFLLKSPSGDIEMGINQTRMAMLLLSSFNASVNSETAYDLWDRVYEPTVFYVGSSDDLNPIEYYQIWKSIGFPDKDELASRDTVLDFIDEANNYRDPKINSMFVGDDQDINVTKGFRLMGQRFIPDSYIFQQLIHDAVNDRLLPTGLDVFTVFGSPRAAYYMENESIPYPDYPAQVNKLTTEFGNLTENDWTQNLYWLWLYTLFPLLEPADETGYPQFMQSDAWSDKALMTAMGSWAELRHDTILYAKQAYSKELSIPEIMKGYVEPYPEVYSRLASLTRMMEFGLKERNLLVTSGFIDKLTDIADVFDRLTELSIKELENTPLNSSEYSFINTASETIGYLASYADPEYEDYTSATDDRMAVVADVATDPNSNQVLEVATGNPFVIYAVVPDHNGQLRLVKGGTFSYYEFRYPMNNRLSDENWHILLDTNPPSLPDWIIGSIPIISASENLIITTEE